jgi:S-adenosyl-L-methionine hydrolase (adenosine-forming)
MSTITLLTDFGLLDGYPGIMKGVIYSINPDVQIADLTHLIAPQNIHEGALAISRSYRYFPENTIHVAVIDPGVGTRRRPIAAKIGSHYFVGPDNGLFTFLFIEAKEKSWPVEIVHLNRTQYWLPSPSNVFHGRDVFAPVAAHLSKGVKLDELGEIITDPVLLDIPTPQRIENGWSGTVIGQDHFGNLSTNILAEHLLDLDHVEVTIGSDQIKGLVQTFGDRPPGELIALMGTDQDLCISIVNGNASQALNMKIGAPVTVTGIWNQSSENKSGKD